MQNDEITGEESRAGRIVKNGRIARLLLISLALIVVGFLIVGYFSAA